MPHWKETCRKCKTHLEPEDKATGFCAECSWEHEEQLKRDEAEQEIEKECEWCDGKGEYVNEDHPKYPEKIQMLECYHCDGTGKVPPFLPSH